MAGLLTRSFPVAFPSAGWRTVTKDTVKLKELTAAGTVQAFHLIPF